MFEESLDLIYPMTAMFAWTFVVMVRNVQVRLAAVGRGELTNAFFELFAGASPGPTIVKTGNQLRNLCEFPPLFYVVALAIIVTGWTDATFTALAWGYVAARAGHTLVHLTINRVPPRFLFWATSNVLLLAMWIRLAWRCGSA